MPNSLRALLCGACCALFCLLGSRAHAADDEAPSAIENSVVKIFATSRAPDPFRPWSKQQPREASGSGVVIDGKRILTNAHVVRYAGQIQVQASRDGNKISATVEHIAHGIDLAVLKLDDESFFQQHPAVKLADQLPAIKDTVLAYGFPTGGTSLSITKGIISRIEFAAYNYPVSGLRIQVDAAINPGNSGGPAFAGGKMVGLAYAGIANSQSIGYIIPNEEIQLFLKDVADGRYDGKPTLFDNMQTLDNVALRAYLKLDKTVQGVVVQAPFAASETHPLKEWDIITHIGDAPIDNEGMVKVGSLRLRFLYHVPRMTKNGTVPLTLLRGGRVLKVQAPVAYDRPLLIPDLRGGYPSYFIYGPVVFSTATTQFLGLFNNNANLMHGYAMQRHPLIVQRGDAPSDEQQELVVIASPFFPHKLVNGYGSRFASVLKSVNDVPVRSLKHLVEWLRDCKDEYVILRFHQHGAETLVFPHKEMLAATEDILNDNGVRAQGSSDMLEVWERRTAP